MGPDPKSREASIAKKLKKQIERDIERGAFTGSDSLGFAAAAAAYMKADGDRNYLAPLIAHFKNLPLISIDQHAIDTAAAALYPNATAATRNRQVYTPISAVLKRAGYEHKIKRPKGWRGQRLTHWLRPEQAFAVFKATEQINAPESTRIAFRVLLRLLCYTGMRLGDALGLQCRNVDLNSSSALLPTTKNENPRLVYLPKIVIEELRRLPDGLNRDGRVFRFHDGGRLRDLFKETLAIAGITLPRRVAFHVFCHTWATWMRQHGGLDTFDLLKTDRWSDAESADRYAHVVVSEQAKKADMLPVERRRKKAR
jgi:integrase